MGVRMEGRVSLVQPFERVCVGRNDVSSRPDFGVVTSRSISVLASLSTLLQLTFFTHFYPPLPSSQSFTTPKGGFAQETSLLGVKSLSSLVLRQLPKVFVWGNISGEKLQKLFAIFRLSKLDPPLENTNFSVACGRWLDGVERCGDSRVIRTFVPSFLPCISLSFISHISYLSIALSSLITDLSTLHSPLFIFTSHFHSPLSTLHSHISHFLSLIILISPLPTLTFLTTHISELSKIFQLIFLATLISHLSRLSHHSHLSAPFLSFISHISLHRSSQSFATPKGGFAQETSLLGVKD